MVKKHSSKNLKGRSKRFKIPPKETCLGFISLFLKFLRQLRIHPFVELFFQIWDKNSRSVGLARHAISSIDLFFRYSSKLV